MRVVPRDELAVHPDLLGRRDGHRRASRSCTTHRRRRSRRRSAWSCLLHRRSCRRPSGFGPTASASPRNSHIIAAEMTAARGSAFPVPGDVGRRAVDRLEQRRAGAGRIEVGRGGPADPAGDRAAEVGEDVAEEVVGDDHVVAAGILRRNRCTRRRRGCTRWPTSAYSAATVVERALPEVAGEREHVGLVHEREVLGGRATGRARTRSARTARRRCACSPIPASRSRAACPWRRKPPSPA